MKRSAVKAYDVRGQLPKDLNVPLAYRFAQACTAHYRPAEVVIGHDMRQDSPALAHALAQGFLDSGVSVLPLGLCGTEEVYFNTDAQNADLGLMVTASHNPAGDNGIKMILRHAHPVTRENGLDAVEALVYGDRHFEVVESYDKRGMLRPQLAKDDYIARLLRAVDGVPLKPLKVVCHAGNGCAGQIIDLLEGSLPLTFVKVDHQPDPRLPNGVPNPLLPEKRARASAAVVDSGADFGIAWDGDFDRCFFYDHEGSFIEGYYLVGLIAQSMLRIEPGAKILFDPRLTWNTEDAVRSAGGVPVICKTGHAYFKQAMRDHGAIYGGEMSAHHYFRDFSCCDTGMLPWLVVLTELCRTGEPLKQLIADRVAKFPCSGEINFKVADSSIVLDRVRDRYEGEARSALDLDGLSLDFDDWRFNLRSSNTEPLLRLNIESREDAELVSVKLREMTATIMAH